MLRIAPQDEAVELAPAAVGITLGVAFHETIVVSRRIGVEA
jgi:hypothetical protein